MFAAATNYEEISDDRLYLDRACSGRTADLFALCAFEARAVLGGMLR